MTREDAIEKLKRADITVGCKVKTKTAEAIEMAIQALEQEPILDKIRAEIEQIADEEQKHDKKWAIGLRYAVNIIDKYKVKIIKQGEIPNTSEIPTSSTSKNDLEVDWDELKRKILMEVDGGTDDKWLSYADVCDNISSSIDDFKADLPSVTPQEPRKGHWIDDKCSVCGKGTEDLISSREWYKNEEPIFCPFCGAKMVEPKDGEK